MDALPPALTALRPAITRNAQFYFGLPAPLALIAAQMAQESGFNTSARSRTGAAGLMQFMPATAKWAGQQIGAPADASDPEWSIRAGIWYDRWLYDRVSYPTDCDRFGAALSAYNGGLGWHNKRKAIAASRLNYSRLDFWSGVAPINPGIAAASQMENVGYPRRIIFQLQARFKALGGRLVCLPM